MQLHVASSQPRSVCTRDGQEAGQHAFAYSVIADNYTYASLSSPQCAIVANRERLSSPRSMLPYVILLNIHKRIGYKFGIA